MFVLVLLTACGSDTGGDTVDTACGGAGCDRGVVRREGELDAADADVLVGGAVAGDELGAAVAVGDATGDGRPDLLVGARGETSGKGGAWLFAGPLTPGPLDVADASAHLTAADTVQLGTEGCLGPDLTGDGVGDLVVGSRSWMRAPVGGAAFVIPGPVSGELDAAEAGTTLLSGEEDDLFGIAVSCGGDATGDGAPDLLVGARSRDGRAPDAGAAFLFPSPVTATGPADAVLTVRGEGGDDAAGRAVDLRSDLDGDGLADVVVGAYRQSAEVGFGGAVYVVTGGTTGVVDLGDADVVLRATEDGASAGRALTSAGDLDGDGRADLVVGLSGVNALAGAVAVLTSPLPATGSFSSASARFSASTADANAGFAVLADADLDGDGVDELGVGAPGQHGDGRGTLPGEAWLFYGPVAGALTAEDAAIHVTTSEAGAGLGYALAAGDLDDDGRDDVAIGANFFSPDAAGGVAVLFGAAP